MSSSIYFEHYYSSCDDDTCLVEEYSPCHRWTRSAKRICGNDECETFIGQDMRSGNEIVWNEMTLPPELGVKVINILEQISRLKHKNLLEIFDYWILDSDNKVVVKYITEKAACRLQKYFTKSVIKGTKMNLSSWRSWCIQLVNVFIFLHSFQPPLIHGHLRRDNVYIQSNGAVKLSMTPPYLIRDFINRMNTNFESSTKIDISLFGKLAMDLLFLNSKLCIEKDFEKHLAEIKNEHQRDFFKTCVLQPETVSMRDLLFHPILFEVPSLKILAAHVVINHFDNYDKIFDDDHNLSKVIATICSEPVRRRHLRTDNLDQLLDEVKNGVHPLIVISGNIPKPSDQYPFRPENKLPERYPREPRRIIDHSLEVNALTNGLYEIILILKFDNNSFRKLKSQITTFDTPEIITNELVTLNLIHKDDGPVVKTILDNYYFQALHKSL